MAIGGSRSPFYCWLASCGTLSAITGEDLLAAISILHALSRSTNCAFPHVYFRPSLHPKFFVQLNLGEGLDHCRIDSAELSTTASAEQRH